MRCPTIPYSTPLSTALSRTQYPPIPSSSFRQQWRLSWHIFSRRVRPSSPKNEQSMTLVIYSPSQVEGCGGCHGISSRYEEVCRSSPKNARSMTMVVFFHSSVECCGGGDGIYSKEEEVCPSSPKKEGSMTMAIFLPSSVESCGGGHVTSS